ncbi:hypothetical protein DV737_g3191, partial [Chaetothyriales sp. CBS 132003]
MADQTSTTTSTATGFPLFEPNVPPIPPAFSEFFTSYTHITSDELPDLRKLIWDVSTAAKAPPTGTQELNLNVFGADLKPEFIDIGYELFADEATLPRSQFITPADVFDDAADAPLARLDGKVSVVNCTCVFHLFDWDGQALVVGTQIGDVNPGEHKRMMSDAKRYAHNDETWEKLWKEAVATPEWEAVVKDVRVWSKLHKPSQYVAKLGQEVAVSLDEKAEEIRARIAKRIEQGLRAHIFSVCVDFH